VTGSATPRGEMQLQSASSITLGCLDRIWLATEEHQVEQQGQGQHLQEHAQAPTLQRLQPASCDSYLDPKTGARDADPTAGRGVFDQPITGSHLCAAPATPDQAASARSAAASESSTGSSQRDGSSTAVAGEVSAAHDAVSCSEQQQRASPSNAHLYKGVGAVSSFQLLALPHANDAAATAQHSTPPTSAGGEPQQSTGSSQADDTQGAVSGVARDKGPMQVGSTGLQGSTAPQSSTGPKSSTGLLGSTGPQSRCVSAASDSSHRPHLSLVAAVGRHTQDLAAASVTLAQLASRPHQQHQTHQEQQLQEGAPQRGAADGRRSRTHDGSSSAQHVLDSRAPHLTPGKPGKVLPLLATAGIKGGGDQYLTPLAWKLLQQQHQAQHRQAQQDARQLAMKTTGSPQGASSTVEMGEISKALEQGSQQQQQQQQQQEVQRQREQQRLMRSPHRRSFDLPGSTSGMGAAFGAGRQHVARMRLQAGEVSNHSLLGMAAAQMQGGGAAGSRRGSLDRTTLPLGVATSLAGALPGCVSEKLSQYLQVYGAGGGGSSSASGADADGTAAASSASHVQHVGGEVGAGVSAQRFSEVEASTSSSRRRSLSLFRQGSVGCAGVVGSSVGRGTETCAVCMDAESEVAMVGCSHSLCFTCAGCIVGQGVGVRPPLCPFCRSAIRGLQLTALTGSTMA
jgi:hypothetical protein